MAGWDEYKCYSPQLVAEFLSPSNSRQELNSSALPRCRMEPVSFGSSIWKTMSVTTLAGVRDYHPGESIEVLQSDLPRRQACAAAQVAAIFP
jgi:hypothetical protein